MVTMLLLTVLFGVGDNGGAYPPTVEAEQQAAPEQAAPMVLPLHRYAPPDLPMDESEVNQSDDWPPVSDAEVPTWSLVP